MAMVEWSSSYETGLADVDAQHRHLVGVINDLAEMMREGKPREELAKTINELMKYTVKHFALEERYFKKHGYAKAREHIAKHEEFEAKVHDFADGFKDGRVALRLEVMTFLGDWLVNHINGEDKAYAPFLLERGEGKATEA